MRALIVGVVSASIGASAAHAAPANQAAPTCVVPPQGVVVVIDTPNPNAEISPGGNVNVTSFQIVCRPKDLVRSWTATSTPTSKSSLELPVDCVAAHRVPNVSN
jgi:hypothetical protein